MRMALLVCVVLVGLPLAASAQDAAPRPDPTLRSVGLAYQQMGSALELLSMYYQARIEELKRLCGDPCKDK